MTSPWDVSYQIHRDRSRMETPPLHLSSVGCSGLWPIRPLFLLIGLASPFLLSLWHPFSLFLVRWTPFCNITFPLLINRFPWLRTQGLRVSGPLKRWERSTCSWYESQDPTLPSVFVAVQRFVTGSTGPSVFGWFHGIRSTSLLVSSTKRTPVSSRPKKVY